MLVIHQDKITNGNVIAIVYLLLKNIVKNGLVVFKIIYINKK